MAVKFGVLVPQGWHFDLQEVEGAGEQFEAMVRVVLGTNMIKWTLTVVCDELMKEG